MCQIFIGQPLVFCGAVKYQAKFCPSSKLMRLFSLLRKKKVTFDLEIIYLEITFDFEIIFKCNKAQ